MGNTQVKKRVIKVGNLQSRVPKQEKQNLKEAFDRIQDSGVINDYQFRMEVIGPQVPESIAVKLFQIFSSEEAVPEQMNFDDLLACYLVFKHGKIEELGQACFELMKMATGSEYLSREHIQLFTEKIVQQNDQVVHTFYAKTLFDPRLPIKKGMFCQVTISQDDFESAFKKVHNLSMFTWVPKLIEGYSRNNMNMDETSKSIDFSRRLTLISHERQKTETQALGFNDQEHDSMQEFFNTELRKNDAKSVLKTIQRMFKDIRDSKLRRYFIEDLTKHKALDFKYLSEIALIICRETDSEKKIKFLYDIFSQHQEPMKKKQMKDFDEIFKLGGDYFTVRGATISKEDFISDVKNIGLELSLYEKSKYAFMAMMALRPSTDDDEKESILSILDYNHNIEAYINQHLDEEDTFYAVEKHFFESWCIKVGFHEGDTKSFVVIKDKPTDTIDNLSLIEPFHEYRMREVTYNQEFVLVPKYVFIPLSKWYSCNKVIERKVISYKQTKQKSLQLFKQKKTTSVIISSQAIPDNFFKTVGDLTYELEIYPKFLYFEKITDKGERPHQKAIVNQKIDQNYMKKTLKSEKIPFQELLISRKATFEEVLKQISAQYKENQKRGRLWIEDQVISGAKLEETLEEFGVSMGQIIYAEYANANNQWPTDSKMGTSMTKSQLSTMVTANSEIERKEALKSSGLYNLGNTCYMNSALQCLANTRFFYEYFIKDKRYIKQMNLKSKYGHQGELANNFAQLMQKMWSNANVAIPRNFKNCISQISEQFQGYDQQDSQEFLSFLLDGLHEELNLRQDKPYLENPDSDSRKILELGLESWSNTLRRDWSFVFWLFYGQLKSALNCQTCNKLSVTFDIFTNIPLSLPEPSKILLNVIIYRLPNELKDLVNGGVAGEQKGNLKRMDSQRSDEGRQQSRQEERDPQFQKFQESFKYMTNDQPIHISIRVEKDIKIVQLMQLICEVKEVNIDPASRISQLCLYSQAKGTIRGIFNPEYRLTQYNLLTNEVEAFELLTRKGREVITNHYKQNPQILEQNPNSNLACLVNGNSEKIAEENMRQQTQSSTTASKKRPQSKSGKDSQNGMNQKIDKCNLFNSYVIAYERYQEFEEGNNFPEDIFAVAYHRRFVKKSIYFFQPYQPQLLSSPMILLLPIKPTGRRVYEEVWSVAQILLKKSSIYHNKKNRWWEQKGWEDKIAKDNETYKPFVLKTVERSGFSCSQCHWMQACSGCILPPSDVYIEDFFKKCHLAVEWHSQLIEDDYNQQANEVLHHSSTQDKQIIDDDFINLEDCLRKFHEVEEIGSADHIYCSNCKTSQGHLKKLEIFRPPPILIIQLKRFKFSNAFRNKLTTLVEFPLYNLDLSTFVTDVEFLNSMNIDLKYDLYGIINHYGTLSFGHYISIIKNLQENKWYKYDDSSRTQISEEQIQKENAYILFYIRKDVQLKNLDDIMPSLKKDLFPGKPISTEKGSGFIIGKEGPASNGTSTTTHYTMSGTTTAGGQFKVQYEKGKDTELLMSAQILEEKDDDEIKYDAKDMQEIQSQKKEKTESKNRKRKARRCLGICGGNTRRVPASSQPKDGESKDAKTGSKKPIKRGGIKGSLTGTGSNTGSQCYIF